MCCHQSNRNKRETFGEYLRSGPKLIQERFKEMNEFIKSLKDELNKQNDLVETESFINGSCSNESRMHIPIYGPNYKGDNFHNSIYMLESGKKTKSDFDCDGIFIPQGFKAQLTGGRIIEGPIAIKFDNLKRVRVTHYDKLIWTIPNPPNAIFTPDNSACDNQSGHVCWPILKTFEELEKYSPNVAPTEP